MKIITLTEQKFDNYALNHKNASFYQSSQYGQIMQKHGFMVHYIGFIDSNNTIHAAALILYKKLFGTYKWAYAPRGFLIDYNDTNLLKTFTIKLRRLLSKQNFIFIKIDPFVIYREMDKEGTIINEQNASVIKYLKKFGYIHQEYNNYFATLMPRCNAIVNYDGKPEELFLSLSKNMQVDIKKAIKRGVTIHRGEREDIEILYNITKNKRGHKLNFYFDYYDIFKEKNMIDIYYAKLNPITYLSNVQKLYNKENQKNINLIEKMQITMDESLVNKKIESDKLLGIYKKEIVQATNFFKHHPEGLIIAAALVINYNKKLYFILDGHNPKYKDHNPNHLLKWLIIAEHLEKGYSTINLNGINNPLDKNNKYDGLNKFKMSFGSTAAELIGEFNLPLNRILYHLFIKTKILRKILIKNIKKH